MEIILEQLKNNGWFLSDEGYQLVTGEGNITNLIDIEKKAINFDIREIGGCGFPSELPRGKNETINGNVVVQIQKIRNISAPKLNEESQGAPRMLKLSLTDGTVACPAIEIIHLDTAPGTKLKLKGEILMSCGYILLTPSNVEVLGGVVTNLVEKWTINRNLAKQARGRVGAEGGPPPWIPFGEKIMSSRDIADKGFKSLDSGNKENKDNDEFEAQRRDAIAEAGKCGTKKVFGGGTKPLIDKNVQIIMGKGFTMQQAESALKQTKNNVDKALKSLMKRTNKGNEDKDKEKEGNRRRKGDEEVSAKPSGKISLLQYLEDKIPFLPEKEKPIKEKEHEWESNKYEFNGNQKRNFNADKPRGGHRGSYNNSGNDRRPREDSTKNHKWQGPTQNQKPPRFQNQFKRVENNDIDQFMGRDILAGSSTSRNAENYFNKTSHQYSNGYRNFFKGDNPGYNNQSGDYRNHNSLMKPAGMPDIPEFPYKDNSFMSMVPHSNNGISGNRNGNASKQDKYKWKMGEKCLAKYWEDNEYYNAEVTGVSKKTCVVRFLEYGNFEEVLQDDCLPVEMGTTTSNHNFHDDRNVSFDTGNRNNNFTGVLQFRRGGSRPSFPKPSGDGMGSRKNQRYSQQVYMPPPGRSATK